MDPAERRREYESAGIDLPDLADDPITQFQAWMADAVAAGLHEPEAMTLCTVDAQGRPSSRYVLVRGVDERGFAFYTNYDSDKARQLAAQPAVAITFGWLALHRQVRVEGMAELLPAQESDAYFAGRPRGSQIGAWASPQSRVLANREELDRLVAGAEAAFAGAPVPRPPHWGGYLVRPERVEFWQGRRSRLHDRLRYRRADGAWRLERLAP